MKNTLLISIVLSMNFQFTYGQLENSTASKEINNYGNVKPITEKYYSTKYKNDTYKKVNLQSSYVYNFNENRNILPETAEGMNALSKPLTNLKFYESGIAYPNLNYLKDYNKNQNWKERMLNDNKHSTFISDMLRGMLTK